MRILAAILFTMIGLSNGRGAEVPWQGVAYTARPWGFYVPGRIKVSGEQATLETSKQGRGRWFGWGGPRNSHTRNLRFAYQGRTYAVPQPFVDDLLQLHLAKGGATSPFALRASVDGADVVFTLMGADGEKGYTVYFHFRSGRLFQRILSYTEAQTILIRTNDR